MPDYKARKRREKQHDPGKEPLERRGVRGSGNDSPPSQTRGERKKISLNETTTPIEQGGDYP
jgi:hypothetical protein